MSADLLGLLQAAGWIAVSVIAFYRFLYPLTRSERRDREEIDAIAVRFATVSRVRDLERSLDLEPWYDEFWYDLERKEIER